MPKHIHYNPHVNEEVETEDGKMKYWRIAVPLPFYTTKFFFRQAYQCACSKKFYSHAEYELHFRKAAWEEESFNDGPDFFKK